MPPTPEMVDVVAGICLPPPVKPMKLACEGLVELVSPSTDAWVKANSVQAECRKTIALWEYAWELCTEKVDFVRTICPRPPVKPVKLACEGLPVFNIAKFREVPVEYWVKANEVVENCRKTIVLWEYAWKLCTDTELNYKYKQEILERQDRYMDRKGVPEWWGMGPEGSTMPWNNPSRGER